MYLVKIKTKYNLIELTTDNVNSDELKELFNQSYVKEVYIETLEHYYKEEIDKLLSHVVGMSYNTEKALELSKKINEEMK